MSAGSEEETWMNVDGKDVRLKFISPTKPTKPDDECRGLLGSQTSEKFNARNIMVEIVLAVTDPSPVNEPGCESMGFKAVFNVREGKGRQTVKAE